MSVPLILVAAGHCGRTLSSSIFSLERDNEVSAMGVRVLRTPVRAPKANSVCERFGGTFRRECLDFLIPFNAGHIKSVLESWEQHFNHGRPHIGLGPAIPAPLRPPLESSTCHQIPPGLGVRSTAILGGLHHEYWLEQEAA
jgi:putative transposase